MRVQKLDESVKKEVLSILKQRGEGGSTDVEKIVGDILEDVKKRGDAALFEYTERFDKTKVDAGSVRVSAKEMEEAFERVGDDFRKILKKAAERIREYHKMQLRRSFFETAEDGSILGQRITSIENAGVYVPGGKAAYPSSTLMNIIPAKVAGVKKIVVCTPPGKDGKINDAILAAAYVAGADEVYKAGGAQAIAAMAFGTESIPRVDKIVGPGNIFVALAKKSVYGAVSIDSVAGPSEILVLADESADPEFVAADLLSQAEHDEMASAILITTDETLGDKVLARIGAFLPERSRRAIIEKSLEDYGFILVAKDMDEALDMVNLVASEHLEILTKEPWTVMPKVKNAGAIFLGPYSCEPLGDYMAGPNHVLPTGGSARFFSPLSVDDFIKKSSIIAFSKEGLGALIDDIDAFAMAEGLDAHAESARIRKGL